MGAPCHIRAVEAADLEAVHTIERAAFSDPWSLRQFEGSLAAGCEFLLAERGRQVVGYVIAQRAAEVAEILNLGVAPTARRAGAGRSLVRAIVGRLAALGVRNLFLEVRESNRAALRLYAQEGFAPVGRRTGYYRRPVEDAVVLMAAISTETGDA